MSFEDHPTQRLHRQPRRSGYAPDAPTTAMPGPLNLAGDTDAATQTDTTGDTGTDTTGVLPLDELFETEPVVTAAPATPATTAGAPTWTPMPLVDVRSEPARPGAHATTTTASPTGGPGLGSRVHDDAAAAWEQTVRRVRAWLGRDDNALTLLTAVVAVILIVVVTALGG